MNLFGNWFFSLIYSELPDAIEIFIFNLGRLNAVFYMEMWVFISCCSNLRNIYIPTAYRVY
jgi:hypothetical protein